MTQPNVLLCVFDDLGIIDTTEALMPSMWAFVNGGGARAFTRCYSMPICSQSRSCIMYGKYGRNLTPPIIVGQSPHNGPEPIAAMDTLPALLSGAGYATCLIGKHHLGRNVLDTSLQYIGAPQCRGFAHWLAGAPENLDSFTSWLRVDDDVQTTETEYATAAQVAAALAWWNATSSPKFMQVSLSAPHGPYHFPPADELGGFVSTAVAANRRKYESEIRSADWAFAQLLAACSSDTIVCVVGDNGTPENTPAPGQNPAHLKSTCYEGGIRVPMAIKSSYPAGTTDRLVHIVDIPATLLTLAGVAVPLDWDGQSLTGPSRTTCLAEAQLGLGGDFAIVRAAMTKRYKLLHTEGHAEELYDLLVDPNETTKLSLTDPKYAATLELLRGVLGE